MELELKKALPNSSGYCSMKLEALFCWSCFGLFHLVSAYSLSQNTIESAETSWLFHQPRASKKVLSNQKVAAPQKQCGAGEAIFSTGSSFSYITV
jgi:hypothetical protein